MHRLTYTHAHRHIQNVLNAFLTRWNITVELVNAYIRLKMIFTLRQYLFMLQVTVHLNVTLFMMLKIKNK